MFLVVNIHSGHACLRAPQGECLYHEQDLDTAALRPCPAERSGCPTRTSAEILEKTSTTAVCNLLLCCSAVWTLRNGY